MKKIFILAIAALSFASCQQNTAKRDQNGVDTSTANAGLTLPPASPDAPILTFEKTTYDFGKIKQGEKVHYDFTFTNTGKTPLIISNATASCGCTVPEPPKDPIQPGAQSVIKVIFDSTGKSGKQDKVITVTSNGNPSINEVHLTGEVLAPTP